MGCRPRRYPCQSEQAGVKHNPPGSIRRHHLEACHGNESANYSHTPFSQVAGAAHAVPHAPQLALSLPRFVQAPLQSARPGAHDEQQRNPVSG